ncbi:MAG: glycine zipper 2TM domain-containing protein [Sinobacteraceae bacterium]|nr:glycine zipper 2TM domain-containing protein [Nevskiaceae bacterium]
MKTNLKRNKLARGWVWMAALGSVAALSACAYQQQPYGYGDASAYGQPYGAQTVQQQAPPADVQYETVDVLSSTPSYQQVQVARPRQECARVPVNTSGRSTVGTLVGGALGGLVGNQFGGGTGKAAMTALGAVAGAIAGDKVASGPPGATTTRCRTVNDYVMKREADGYDVSYRYNGQVYHTHRATDPGSKMRIRVAVTPQ